MRAITLWRPWPTFLLREGPDRKDCENRTQPPPKGPAVIGRRVALHAGKSYKIGKWPMGGEPPTDSDCPIGIVGTVLVVGALDLRLPISDPRIYDSRGVSPRSMPCLDEDDEKVRQQIDALDKSPWWLGPVGILMIKPMTLEEPIVVPGAQGWWVVDDDVTVRIREEERRRGW